MQHAVFTPVESTLSVENVAAVLMQIEGDVSSVLEKQEFSIGGCPLSVCSRISSLSGEEKIRAAASLYITSHGCPSWKLLSLLLYEVGEMKAAESAMTNFSKGQGTVSYHIAGIFHGVIFLQIWWYCKIIRGSHFYCKTMKI